MKHQGPSSAPESALLISLDPSQRRQLATYEQLLEEVALPRGMVAAGDRARLHERHVLDSLRGASLLDGAADVVDLGSGAGLPGIPIAIALPGTRFVLSESRQARALFLELARDSVPVANVEVAYGPAERLGTSFQACLARAFGPPARSWEVAERLLAPGGRLLYWAGSTFRDQDVPPGVAFEVVTTSALANAGPIVIMTRQ